MTSMTNKLTGRSRNAIIAEAKQLKTAMDMADYLNRKKLITSVGPKEIARYCKPEEWHHVANKTRVFLRQYYSLFEIFKHRVEIRGDIANRRVENNPSPIGILREGRIKITISGNTREFKGRVVLDSGADKVTVFDLERNRKYRYDVAIAHILIQNETGWEKLV